MIESSRELGASRELPPELRASLDGCRVRAIVQYVATRVKAGLGEQTLTFVLSNGSLRQTELSRRRIANEELEHLGVGH